MSKASGYHRRNYGAKVKNSNLPAEVPIIGLGCSSFSTFFLKGGDGDGDTTSGTCDSTSSVGSSSRKSLECNQENAHLIPADHEMVQDWIATIIYAIENGVTLLDTAPWYGHGSSEVVIGYALKQLLRSGGGKDDAEAASASAQSNKNDSTSIQRKDIILNTKVGRYDADPRVQFDFSYDATMKSVKRSIERMNCEYIDVLQLHDPEFAPSIELLLEETFPALAECKRLGYAKAIGMTGYPLETQLEILQRAEAGLFDQSLTYGHFNLHNQNLFTKPLSISTDHTTMKCHNDDGKDDSSSACASMSFVEYCQSKSIATMAAAPLSMGLLTHDGPPVWHPASDDLKQACRVAADIAKENGVDLPTLAVLFAICHNDIGCTLLGMGNRKEIDSALSAMRRFVNATHSTGESSCTCSMSASLDNGVGLRNDIMSKLSHILTDAELRVLKILLGESQGGHGQGPFLNLWQSGVGFDWDGVNEAELFWSTVEGGKEKAESRMRR